MAETWANLGADLHLDLGGRRVREAVERALREAVQTGRLAPGTRLPSSRVLAADLGLARNTVAEAYTQLVAEGWLTARQGSGTRVADRTSFGLVECAPLATPPAAGRQIASTKPATSAPPVRYNLRPGSPDVSAFPRSAWLTAARRALTAAPNEALGYGDPRGLPVLRRTLAGYLARARGVRVTADQVVVTSGYVQGLALLAAVLRDSGATGLAVEALGFDIHRDVINRAGLAMRPLRVDRCGAGTEDLPASGVDAALLTPAHQFPTGVPLAPHRRAAAIEWARANGGLVIEDDYDGEFRYDRQPIGALQGLDPEHVVYTGTASKSLAPGLRLAWMVLPARLVEPVAEVKRATDWHTSTFEQLTLAEFIGSGAYDRHVRRSRLRYRRRRDRLVAALAERVPQVRVSGIAAGLHALVELPEGGAAAGEDEVVSYAAERGLALSGLGRFRYVADAGHPQAALVVGYGTPPEHAYSGALEALCHVLATLSSP